MYVCPFTRTLTIYNIEYVNFKYLIRFFIVRELFFFSLMLTFLLTFLRFWLLNRWSGMKRMNDNLTLSIYHMLLILLYLTLYLTHSLSLFPFFALAIIIFFSYTPSHSLSLSLSLAISGPINGRKFIFSAFL